MPTPENNVNPDSSTIGWLGRIFGAKRPQVAVLSADLPPPAIRILSAQSPPSSPVVPEGTGGDSSPDCVDDIILGDPPAGAISAPLPGVLTPAIIAPSPPLTLPLNGEEPQELSVSEIGSPLSSAIAHQPSDIKENTGEIKKYNLSDYNKKAIMYRKYILVTSAVISTLGLGIYILWPKHGQDGNFDFTGISNAPHLCSDFLRTFLGTKVSSPPTTVAGFEDCGLDLPSRLG